MKEIAKEYIKIIEKALLTTLPKEYVKFIEEIGVYRGEYFDVYGYDESIEDIEDYPCVIGATKRNRKFYPLLPQEIMIHHDEYLNSIVVLDCENGRVYNIDFEERKEIAKSFDEWFEWLKRLEAQISQ